MAGDDTSPKWDTVASYAEKLMSGEAPGLESESKDKPKPAPEQAKQRPEAAETSEPSEPAPSDEPEAVAESEAVEETDDETEVPEDEGPAYVTVKIDGKEEQVTLEEALKGYSRQQDYTRKAQDLARERESQKADFEAVRKEREQYAAIVNQIVEYTRPPEPDWVAKRQELDRESFNDLVTDWQIQTRQHDKWVAEQTKVQQKMAEDSQHEFEAAVKKARSQVQEVIPEWKDPAKEAAGFEELLRYIEENELDTRERAAPALASHAPLLLAIRKAMLYDKAKQTPNPKAQLAQNRTSSGQPLITTMKPGTTTQLRKPVSDVTRAKQSLAKTGNLQSAAKFFEAFDAQEEAATRKR